MCQFGEGLNIEAEAAVTLRDRKVAEIIQEVDAEGAVLVRSPPMSGKTSMCSLIARKLRSSGKSVVHVSMLNLLETDMSLDPTAHWTWFWDKFTGHPLLHWVKQGSYIIVDGTQSLYGIAPPLPVVDFWKAVKSSKENASTTQAKFILFCSFSGSSISGAGTFTEPLGVDFMSLRPDEVDELYTSYHERLAGQSIPIDKDIFEMMVDRCGGHIGFIRATLTHMYNHFVPGYLSSRPPLSRQAIVEFLHSSSLITSLAQIRAVASAELTSKPAVKELLMRVLNSGDYTMQYFDTNAVMLMLIKSGMLVHVRGGKVGFASPIIKDVLTWRFLRSQEETTGSQVNQAFTSF